jgi:hypothetical protein
MLSSLRKALFGKKWAKRSSADRFTEVFEQRMWRSEESASGPGSDRSSRSVTHCIDLLHRFTQELDLKSIADAPCGDFNWMPAFLDQHPEVDYVGYDVVPAVIAQNRQRHPGRRFETLDLAREVPAQADLVFCKDLVNHLYDRDVWAALENMVKSGAKYLMITSNRGSVNTELDGSRADASRHLDLEAQPYSLPKPIYGDHYIALWRREDVERRLQESRAARPV